MKRCFSIGWIAFLCASVMTLTWTRLVQSDFEKYDWKLDLSRDSDAANLDAAWRVEPVPHWPGVVRVFDRGGPVRVTASVPRQEPLFLRLKVLPSDQQGQLRIRWNATLIGTWHFETAGEANKSLWLIPASLAQAGTNEIQLESSAGSGLILYEQIRVRNFRSALWKKRWYVLPGGAWHPRGHLVSAVMSVIGSTALFLALCRTTSWVTALPLAAFFSVCLGIDHMTPFRLVFTPKGFWHIVLLLLVSGQGAVMVPRISFSWIKNGLPQVPAGGSLLVRRTGRLFRSLLARQTGRLFRSLLFLVWGWMTSLRLPSGHLWTAGAIWIGWWICRWRGLTVSAEWLEQGIALFVVSALLCEAIRSVRDLFPPEDAT